MGPYEGITPSIPGSVEAEEFDYGGEGIGYSDTDAGNIGGVSDMHGAFLVLPRAMHPLKVDTHSARRLRTPPPPASSRGFPRSTAHRGGGEIPPCPPPPTSSLRVHARVAFTTLDQFEHRVVRFFGRSVITEEAQEEPSNDEKLV